MCGLCNKLVCLCKLIKYTDNSKKTSSLPNWLMLCTTEICYALYYSIFTGKFLDRFRSKLLCLSKPDSKNVKGLIQNFYIFCKLQILNALQFYCF